MKQNWCDFIVYGHTTAGKVLMVFSYITLFMYHICTTFYKQRLCTISEIDIYRINAFVAVFFFKENIYDQLSKYKMLRDHSDYLVRAHLDIMIHFMKYKLTKKGDSLL